MKCVSLGLQRSWVWWHQSPILGSEHWTVHCEGTSPSFLLWSSPFSCWATPAGIIPRLPYWLPNPHFLSPRLQDLRRFMLNPVNLFSNATHMLSLITSQSILSVKTDEFLRATLRLDSNLNAYTIKDQQWSYFHSLFLEQSISLFNDWPWNYSSRALWAFVSVPLVQVSDSMQNSSNHSHKYCNSDT